MMTAHERISPGRGFAWLLAPALFMLLLAACQSPDMGPIAGDHSTPITPEISVGDTVQLTFPGATNLSGIHRVGSDGTITLPFVGQIHTVGKTTGQLEAELREEYSTELNDPTVLVSLAASANVIYLSGAVLQPGPIEMNRPMTVLEAIMQGGGYAPDMANLEKVGIIRREDGTNRRYTLDLTPLIEGRPSEPFYVKPRDIIIVPEKIQWF